MRRDPFLRQRAVLERDLGRAGAGGLVRLGSAEAALRRPVCDSFPRMREAVDTAKMTNLRLRSAFLPLAGALLLIPIAFLACSSDETGTTPAGSDASTTTPEGGGTPEASTPEASAGGDSSLPVVDSGLCSDTINGGAVIPEVQANGAKPAPAGGAIPDGTYYLTNHDVYSPSNADANSRKRTIVFAGNTVRTAENDTGEKGRGSAGTYTISGSNITFSVTCPVVATVTIPYTATATTFATFTEFNDVFTSTKQ